MNTISRIHKDSSQSRMSMRTETAGPKDCAQQPNRKWSKRKKKKTSNRENILTNNKIKKSCVFLLVKLVALARNAFISCVYNVCYKKFTFQCWKRTNQQNENKRLQT